MSIRESILAAKKRVFEDLFVLVSCGDSAEENDYDLWQYLERRTFRHDLARLNKLMQLDENSAESLEELKKAGYHV